jgi:hypothetical protein
MITGKREQKVFGEKHAPEIICPPYIPYGLDRD